MEFQVNTNHVILAQINQVESGEYNVTECRFNFSSEYEGLTKIAVFTGANGDAYKITILNNKCEIPSELLTESQIVQIGVYAYEVQGTEFVLRYSPMPTRFMIEKGSYVVNAVNMSRPTPTEVEQLQSQITHNANDIEDLQQTVSEHTTDISNIQSDINDIKAEQTEQNTNIQKNTDDIVNINQAIDTINTDITDIDSAIGDINEDIDNLEQDLTNYSLITETGSQINLNVNSTNYQITAILKDKNGNVIYTSNAIDLPIESMIVNARYDNTTKEIVLTLQNGNTLRISVADLVSGLVSETQLQTILANYYTKTEVDNLLSALAERVSTNEEDIAGIKEEQTTQNTNIEELQSQVETLQEDLDNANSEIAELNTDITNMRKAMYKVDGQGSDITLPNTSENKFVEFGLEGRTEQDGEPTPETPIPIQNVTGNANVKIQNKNLAWTGWAEDFVSRVDNSNIANIITEDNRNCLFYNNAISATMVFNQDWKENTQYTFSFYIKTNYSPNLMIEYTDGTTTQINRSLITINSWSKIEVTSSANKTVKYLRGINEGGNDYIDLDTFMVEQGSTATSYVPHQEQNYPFTFAEGQRGMQGTQLLDDGINNVRTQLVIDGTENITLSTATVGTSNYGKFDVNINKRANVNDRTALCSHLKYKFQGWTTAGNENTFSFTTATTLRLLLDINEFPTVEALKTYLANNNMTFEFVTEQPEIISYNSTQQAQYNDIEANASSYDDITYITSTSDELGFNMNVVAVADANKVINSLDTRLLALESEV